MTKEQRRKLKAIDDQILIAGLQFQNLIEARGRIEQASILTFIDTFCDGLRKLAQSPRPEGQLNHEPQRRP